MRKRGEFKISSMIYATLLAFGLFFGILTATFTSLGGSYDTSSVDVNSLENYSHLDSLSSRIEQQADVIDRQVSVDVNAFDYIAGIFNSILEPFKFIYNSYKTLFTVTDQAVDDLQLFPVFGTWLQAVIIVVVLIGIVLAIYLKVNRV